jgi:hypothetical protein
VLVVNAKYATIISGTIIKIAIKAIYGKAG